MKLRRFSGMKQNAAVLILIFFLILSLLGGCTDTPSPPEITPGSKPAPEENMGTPQQWPAGLTGEPSGVTPLMWLVTAPDGQTMYLFGSIHAADEAIYPLPPAITSALYGCDYLAVEADIVEFEEDMEAVMAMTYSMMYLDGSTVADEIGEELYEKAKAVLAELGPELGLAFSLDLLDNFRPYMWTDLLSAAALGRTGLSYELGLDRYFLYEAARRGMGILEIESIDEQMEILLGFSPPLQAALLESAFDVDGGALALEELYRLWKEGDEQALSAHLSAEDESAELPEGLAEEYTNALLTQRDLRMAEAAKRYMAEGKTVFYVVGLAHLLGEDSVVGLLRQSGYTVERVPF